MQSFPKLLLFLSMLLYSGGHLLAEEPGKLTLIYRVNKENIEISGFEKNNPYFLEKGEKVFPESGGKWSVEGDFENLKRYAYLPDHFALDLTTRSFKQRNNPRNYTLVLTRDTIPLKPKKNSYINWDNSMLDNFIAVGAWIGPEYRPARFFYVEKDSLQDFSTGRFSPKNSHKGVVLGR